MLFEPYDSLPPGSPRAAPPDDLAIRRALLRDVPGIAAILAARNGWDPDVTAQRTAHRVSQPEDAGFHGVATSGGAVLGCAGAVRYAPPADAPPKAAPAGWHLSGLVVDPVFRRRGIGRALTRWRLERIAALTGAAAEVYYFAAASNRSSVDLHAALGFEEVTRDFWFPGVEFSRGDGTLYRLASLAAFHRPEG